MILDPESNNQLVKFISSLQVSEWVLVLHIIVGSMSHVTECEELINVEDVIMLCVRGSSFEESELSCDLRCPVLNFLSDRFTTNKHLLACKIVFIVVLDCLL